MSRVFEHQHYLEFLRSEVALMKSTDPDWSLSKWAREMKMDTVVGLHLIMKGTRRPGNKSIPSFVRFFQFNEHEEKYFRLLVKKDLVAKDRDSLEAVDTKLKVLIGEKKSKFIEDVQFKVIADWYHFAIQQMITRSPVEANPEKIQSLLRYDVNIEQVKEALDHLRQLNVIELKDGFYHAVEVSLRTTFDVPSDALKTHHEQMMKNGLRAIREVPVPNRQIHGRSLVIHKDNLEKAGRMIREFSDSFGVEVDQEDGNQVYQLNIQFFPLSKELPE